MTDFNMLAVDYADDNASQDFAKSLRETGFAVLKNHPISTQLIDDMYAAWQGYFASDTKSDYLFDPEMQDGYFPFRSENAKDSPVKDLKEFYHVYPHGRVPDNISSVSRDFYDQLVTLGQELLDWVQHHSPDDVRSKYSLPLDDMVDKSPQTLLRILHYPAVPPEEVEEGAVRAAAHEDINLITLLVAGSEPGLEAQDADGNWHAVPCDQGMIAINVGDMLEKASRGYYPSTTHRVVNPPVEDNRPRYSMPMFIAPRPDVTLDETYTAQSYLNERLAEIGLKK